LQSVDSQSKEEEEAANYSQSWDYVVGSGGQVTNKHGRIVPSELTLNNGDLIRFVQYQGNLYAFTGESGAQVAITAINPLKDSRFAEIPAWTFQRNADMNVGDTVKIKGIGSPYTYRLGNEVGKSAPLLNDENITVATVDKLDDGTYTFKSLTSQSGFTFQPGDVVAWDDGNNYQYFSDTSETISSFDSFPFKPTKGWRVQSFLENDEILQITAILPEQSGIKEFSRYILANEQPQDISSGLVTGHEHLIYTTGAYLFDGSLEKNVDTKNSEIIISIDDIDFYNGLSEGQIVNYTVQADSSSKQDSYEIEGVQAGIDYYVIKRGIDDQGRGRVRLAKTPSDVVSGSFIEFKDLGIGNSHLLYAETGKTATLKLEADPTLKAPQIAEQAQVAAINIDGVYANGNRVTVHLLNSASGSTTQTVELVIGGLIGTGDAETEASATR
jgi:hypothetical protein